MYKPKVRWMVLTLLCVTVALTSGFNLTILHTNDIHSRIEEMNKYNGRCSSSDAAERKCYGGVERLKTKIDELRALYPSSLLLDGGDWYQGTLYFYVHGGQMLSQVMNLIGYDAMGLGNHEFDNGISGLEPFVANVSFNLLSCNMDLSDTPTLQGGIEKSVVLTVDGEKIGIVGYTTKDTPFISKPETVKFHDEVESIRAEVERLTSQGVDKIIAVGHAGFSVDHQIASMVKGVDVVVGGHTNTFLYTGEAPDSEDPEGPYPTVVQNPDGEQVLVVQDFAYGKYLGLLHVTFDDQGRVTAWGGNPVLMDNSVSKDSEMKALIGRFSPEVDSVTNDTLGRSLVLLDGDRFSCRIKECNMGNMVADAMVRQNLRHADGIQWNHVGVALINSGALRSSISKGLITAGDALAVMPFRNTVDILDISGEVILQALEHSAAGWLPSGDVAGGFLQMAGMSVVYDMTREVGSRVVKVNIVCTHCSIPELKPLDRAQIYKVLTPSYMVSGGDGYTMIKDSASTSHTIGDLDSQLVIDYIKQNSPIATGLEGRISFVQDVTCINSCTMQQISVFSLVVSVIATVAL